jgi:hypothetical protein
VYRAGAERVACKHDCVEGTHNGMVRQAQGNGRLDNDSKGTVCVEGPGLRLCVHFYAIRPGRTLRVTGAL